MVRQLTRERLHGQFVVFIKKRNQEGNNLYSSIIAQVEVKPLTHLRFRHYARVMGEEVQAES
jgi:hypothetical protein